MISTRATRFVSGGCSVRRSSAKLVLHKRFLRVTGTARWATSGASHSQSTNMVARNSESWLKLSWTGAGAALLLMVTATLSSLANCDSNSSFRIKQYYEVVKLLGEGAYGRVFLARRKSDGASVALKAIAREAISNEEFAREVNALKLLSQNGGHPHICRLHDLHDDGNKYYYLVLELISGGELFEHLIRNGPYSEVQASVFVRQFAEAISFMHSKGVVHADLKPENLMMSSEQDDEAQVKVVDLGCAVMTSGRCVKLEKGHELLGTTAYWSPEMFEKDSHPTEASDCWAIGCILFILVTGSHPFDPTGLLSDDEVEENIKSFRDGKYNPFDERLEGLSNSCVTLIKSLLQPDPAKRMNSDEFRRHAWVQGLTASWDTMTDSDRKLEAYWQRRFRGEILRKYAKATSKTNDGSLSDDNLHDIFLSMDLDGNGTLEPEEILVALRGLGVKVEDISEIMKCIDLDGDGTVKYDEFRTIMRKQFDDGEGVKVSRRQQRFRTKILQKFTGSTADAALPEQSLKKIFHTIDLDGNGVLDAHEIRVVLRSVGVDEKDISQIVASIDLDRSGAVDWDEFQTIMNKRFPV